MHVYSLNDLAKKPHVLSFVMILIGVLLISPKAYAQDYACLSQSLSPAKVVRVDPPAIFVVTESNSLDVKEVRGSIPDVEECLRSKGWSEEWHLLYFSDEKYAKFKTEIIDKIKRGEWVKAYLADYNHAESKLILNPASKNPKIYHNIGKDRTTTKQ